MQRACICPHPSSPGLTGHEPWLPWIEMFHWAGQESTSMMHASWEGWRDLGGSPCAPSGEKCSWDAVAEWGGGGRSGLKSDPDFTCAACLLPPPLTSRLIDLRAHGDSGDQVRVVAVLSSGLLDLSLTYSLSHCCCLHVLWGGNSQSEGVVAGPDLSSSLPLACLASAASISMYGNGQGRGRPALRPSHALFCVDAWQKD